MIMILLDEHQKKTMKQMWKMKGYNDKSKQLSLFYFFLKEMTTPKNENSEITTKKKAGFDGKMRQGTMKLV